MLHRPLVQQAHLKTYLAHPLVCQAPTLIFPFSTATDPQGRMVRSIPQGGLMVISTILPTHFPTLVNHHTRARFQVAILHLRLTISRFLDYRMLLPSLAPMCLHFKHTIVLLQRTVHLVKIHHNQQAAEVNLVKILHSRQAGAVQSPQQRRIIHGSGELQLLSYSLGLLTLTVHLK